MSILLHLVNAASQKSSQLFAVKQEKHNSIKILSQTRKLGSINDAILQAIQDENISPPELNCIKYCKRRKNIAEIRRQNKTKVRKITNKEREELFPQGRK